MLFRHKISLVFVLFLTCILSGCVSSSYSLTRYESLQTLCQQSGAQFMYDPIVRSARIIKGSKEANVLIGSDVVIIGVERILLSGPVTLRGNTMYVPGDFRIKILCRLDSALCQGESYKGPRRFCIVIDPGHGGKDPGAIGLHQLKEKDIVLDIARRMGVMLEHSGYEVRLTRRTDEFVSLEQRTEYAAQWQADLFISIHANSSESQRVTGVEIWAPRILKKEDFSEQQRKKNYHLLCRHFAMQQGNTFLDQTLEDLLYRYKYHESLELASVLSKQSGRKISSKNRGVKQSGFFVLRNTLIPSVLVEVGFISNRNEARLLKDSSYRQDFAEVLAQGIRDYIRGL